MILIDDLKANRKNIKGALFMFSFRISRSIRMNKLALIFFFLIPVFHTLFFNWLLGFDIPLKTKIGKGLVIYHGQGLVINADTKVGNNCIIRHNTTIGNKLNERGEDLGSPIIGNDCEIGAHVIIFGPISIGNNCSIGAGTVLTKSIPDNTIAYGNPIQIKEKNESIINK